MKNARDTFKPQQSAFILFLVLLGGISLLSGNARHFHNLSILGIAVTLSLALIFLATLLWLALKKRLDNQQSTYLRIYQQQLQDKLNFVLGRNGSLTDRQGHSLPRSEYQQSKTKQKEDH